MTIKGAIFLIALIIDIISIIGLVKINPYLGGTRNTILIWGSGIIGYFIVGHFFWDTLVVYIEPMIPGGGGPLQVAVIIIAVAPGLLVSFIWSFLEEGPPQLWKKKKRK